MGLFPDSASHCSLWLLAVLTNSRDLITDYSELSPQCLSQSHVMAGHQVWSGRGTRLLPSPVSAELTGSLGPALASARPASTSGAEPDQDHPVIILRRCLVWLLCHR